MLYRFHLTLVLLGTFPGFVIGECEDDKSWAKECEEAVRNPVLCEKKEFKLNCKASCDCSCTPFAFNFDYDNTSDEYDRKTESYMPYMPHIQAVIEKGTFHRFMTIQEQVLTFIGEAKHGLWRTQNNGMVRVHRVKGNKGVKVGANLDDPKLLSDIKTYYRSFRSDLGWFDNDYNPYNPAVPGESSAKFLDLPISHEYFNGVYSKHVPIDLPVFSCTMSKAAFPDVKDIWEYAVAQPNANKIGHLGRRAGLDIKHLYGSVIRLTLFPDASIWINVGGGNVARDIFNQTDIDEGNMDMDVAFRPLDTSKCEFEIYLFMRRSWNMPYLSIGVVINNKENNDMSYVRPSGVYWKTLKPKVRTGLKKHVTFDPVVPIIDEGLALDKTMRYVPMYGVHHLDWGGWCPQKGGLYNNYPRNPTGAGWSNQYEEVTPICDALLIDVKLYANLDQRSWRANGFQLHNAGTRDKKQIYTGKGNQYGKFTDPYLLSKGITNPHALYFTEKNNPGKLPAQKISVSFESIGKTNRYIAARCGRQKPKRGLTKEEKEKRDKLIDQAD